MLSGKPAASQTTEDVIERWIGTLPDSVKWNYGLPPKKGAKPAIFLHGLAASHLHLLNQQQRFDLNFIVLPHANSDSKRYNIFAQALFSAQLDPDIHVDTTPAPDSLWLTTGFTPQPTFRVAIPWIAERELDTAPTADGGLNISFADIGSFQGELCGGLKEQPIAHEYVWLRGKRRAIQTDHKGRFQLEGVPKDPSQPLHLTVRNHAITARWSPDLVRLVITNWE